MSTEARVESKKVPLSIKFIIIGGGIAGLASALALTRVGHEVIVLEKSGERTNRGRHGLRVPPNMSKILFHWGLEQKMRDISLTSHPILFSRLESEELLGTQVWDDVLLRETRGEFMLTTHAELHQLLYEAAVAQGACIRTDAEVVALAPELGQAILACGEVISADVVIGADGETGLSRRTVIGQTDRGAPVGVSVLNATFNTARATSEMPDEVRQVVDLDNNMVFIAFGNGCCAVGYPIRHQKELAFHFLLRDHVTEGMWGDSPSADLKVLVPNPCDPRLRLVADNADDAVRVAVKEYIDLESWVHESARLVLIGQAAHPFPPIAIQGAAMAIEDAAVLGKLFCHLSKKDQIASFLWAFQDIRYKRCTEARCVELSNIFYFSMENGSQQRERDEEMKAKFRAGKNVMEGHDGEEDAPQWKELRETFGYDCEDEADNWWVQWGLLRERSKDVNESRPSSSSPTWGALEVLVSKSTGSD